MQEEGVIVPSTLAQEAEVMRVCFSAFSPEDIQRLSVLEVTEPRILHGGQPVRGGPNDPRLGIIRPGQACQTCLERRNCQGHFGHIKLAEPIFNMGYLPFVEKILKCICHNCTRVKRTNTVDQENKLKRILKIKAPTKRLKALADLLGNIGICSIQKDQQNGNKISGCGLPIPTKISIKEKMRLYVTCKGQKEDIIEEYTAFKIKTIFDKMNFGNKSALGFTVTKPSDLLISVLAVAPPQIRTSIELGPEKRAEDDITNVYSKIIRLNNEIKQGLDNYKKNINLKEIQKLAACIMVKLDKRYLPVLKERYQNRKKSVKKIKSIEERLTSKQGRFRQNLMGKRVDFSARTVISPDPNLEIDQIGVPEDIANNLTVPEVIHELNYLRILNLCLEGKVKFLVQPKTGRLSENYIYLNSIEEKRIPDYLTFGTIAERVLQDGDYVLFNRQPTLHRMSMMAHRVKILPYNTFRLNLSVCSPYNADFDGDEMNMHVPQSVEAIAQLKHIALVHKQVLSPKNSMPVMGLVQDALLAVYLFTSRDTFLTKLQAEELLFWLQPVKQELKERLLPHPCIVRPAPMWSGKQILSCLIPEGLNFDTTPYSEKHVPMSQSYLKTDRQGVLIQRGQIHYGSLLKDHLGPGSGQLIHTIWVEMGAEVTKRFLGSIQDLVSKWLTWQGFSVGINDVMIDINIAGVRNNNIVTLNEQYYKNLHKFRNLPKYIIENLHQKGKHVEDSLEFKINLDLNNTLSKMQKLVVDTVSPHHNNIYKMVMARSKGSETNLAQIMFCLGNQNVNGKRCPLGFQSRALPHFSKEDNSPEPRGFVFSSFFGGLKPQEYFFHSMAGREGLSDTAVKTSSIGYLQRKLVKALEDLQISYDGSVRDSQRNLIQQIYGEDGFLSEFVERHTYNDCKLSEKQFKEKYTWKQEQLLDYNDKQLAVLEIEKEKLLQARIALRKSMADDGAGDIEYHCPINVRRLLVDFTMVKDKNPVIDPVEAVKLVRALISSCRFAIFKNELKSSFSDIGVVIFHMHLRLWLCSKMICLYWKMSKEQLEKLCLLIGQKFKQAIAPAGEAVGALAAQSIGQPTTQMTLNTFHLAGVSDKNVTLGIPRLRELLDVTKNMKTPFMTIHYMRPLEWTENNDSKQLAQIQRIMLSILPERRLRDCLESTHVCFDGGEYENNGQGSDKRMAPESRKNSWTPWVLSLKFDTQRLITGHVWKTIIRKLQEKYKGEFEIRQEAEMGFDRQPEITLRLTAGMLQTIGEKNVFKYMKQKEVEVKDIFLAGKSGIKSVKTSRLTTYNYKDNEGIDLNLESKKDNMVFLAAGSNLKGCLSNPYIDPKKTTTNNLVEVYEVLGIQAARRCFLNQVKEILKPYSIYINHRHLSVLVDWMTCRGYIVPVNRHGINRVTDISVLRKASFEQTMDMLYEAATFSVSDQLKGVSERVIFGQSLNLGTNSCEVHVDLKKIANFQYQQMPKAYIETSQKPLQSFAATPNNSFEQRMNYPLLGRITTPEQSPINGSFSVSPSYKINNSPAFSDRSAQVRSRRSPDYAGYEEEQKRNSMVYQEQLMSEKRIFSKRPIPSQSPDYFSRNSAEPIRPSEQFMLNLKDEDSESESK